MRVESHNGVPTVSLSLAGALGNSLSSLRLKAPGLSLSPPLSWCPLPLSGATIVFRKNVERTTYTLGPT